MKFITLSLTLLFGLLSVDGFAEDTFRGEIRGTLVEQNGDVYTFYFGGDAFSGTQLLYFRQERGQFVSLSGSSFGVDNPRNGKYLLKLEMVQTRAEMYAASIRLFENVYTHNTKGKSIFSPQEILSRSLEAQLNGEGRFSLIEDNKPNLHIELRVDKLFSEAEIKQRLLGRAR